MIIAGGRMNMQAKNMNLGGVNEGGPGSIVKASENLHIYAGFRFNNTVFTKDCDFNNAQITVLEDRSLELKVGGEVVDLATADFIQH